MQRYNCSQLIYVPLPCIHHPSIHPSTHPSIHSSTYFNSRNIKQLLTKFGIHVTALEPFQISTFWLCTIRILSLADLTYQMGITQRYSSNLIANQRKKFQILSSCQHHAVSFIIQQNADQCNKYRYSISTATCFGYTAQTAHSHNTTATQVLSPNNVGCLYIQTQHPTVDQQTTGTDILCNNCVRILLNCDFKILCDCFIVYTFLL